MIFSEYLKVSLWITPLLLLALWLLPKASHRYAAKLPYFVWLVLALRLLVPWNFSLPAETAPIHLSLPQESRMEWTQVDFAGGAEMPTLQGESPLLQEGEQTAAAEPKLALSPMQLITTFWAAGVIFCLLRTAVSTRKLQALLRRWEREPSAETRTFFAELAGEKRPLLLLSPVAESPLATGLLRTKIYLPHEDYSRAELEMIFRHELIHWRRKDLWYKFLLMLAKSIHWYHPAVRLMVRRANRDLEISCDAAAVQDKDAAYRKAYGLMILQEAERQMKKQAALTTCFTEGKAALQERVVEIMNKNKRKKGMALVAMTLILALTCGCLVSYGGSDTADAQMDTALVEQVRAMAEDWAEALETRDGKIRYAMMSQAEKAAFIAEQKDALGEDWNYVIGWSSPWVVSYSVEAKEDTAIITYTMQDSSPSRYTMKELLQFDVENQKLVVTNHITSNLYWDDGKVYPARSLSGMELDEGIWDFLSQSVIGVFSQGELGVYEWEEFSFEIQNVTTKHLDNGRDEVTVDFLLNTKYRNPFCDPAEVDYIKKTKNSEQYETLYQEYYAQKESNRYLRFTCEILSDADWIYEDTCTPDSFRLEEQTGAYTQPYYTTLEDAGFFAPEPVDGWFACVTAAKDGTVAVERQIRIADNSGRTNNGYFDLRVQQGGVFSVAEDAVITMGEAGETPYTLTRDAWLSWLTDSTNGRGGDFTLCFAKDTAGNLVITEVRQGLWTQTVSDGIPSGYPTASKTISAPFTVKDGVLVHKGIDFSTENQKIPVQATADGIVQEAAFDAENGYYVKLNHGNGYLTLYAHLSELKTAVGDSVKKGDTLGLSGKTGRATGIQCHYEIQLQGIYQDPANYL